MLFHDFSVEKKLKKMVKSCFNGFHWFREFSALFLRLTRADLILTIWLIWHVDTLILKTWKSKISLFSKPSVQLHMWSLKCTLESITQAKSTHRYNSARLNMCSVKRVWIKWTELENLLRSRQTDEIEDYVPICTVIHTWFDFVKHDVVVVEFTFLAGRRRFQEN